MNLDIILELISFSLIIISMASTSFFGCLCFDDYLNQAALLDRTVNKSQKTAFYSSAILMIVLCLNYTVFLHS